MSRPPRRVTPGHETPEQRRRAAAPGPAQRPDGAAQQQIKFGRSPRHVRPASRLVDRMVRCYRPLSSGKEAEEIP